MLATLSQPEIISILAIRSGQSCLFSLCTNLSTGHPAKSLCGTYSTIHRLYDSKLKEVTPFSIIFATVGGSEGKGHQMAERLVHRLPDELRPCPLLVDHQLLVDEPLLVDHQLLVDEPLLL